MDYHWMATSLEYYRRRQRKKCSHENDQRSRVKSDGLIEYRRIGGKCHVSCFQIARHQTLNQFAPGLCVKMGIQWCRKYLAAGQRFRGKEKHVEQQEQSDGSHIRFPLTSYIRDRQGPRPAHQISEAAKKSAVDVGEGLEDLSH